MSLLLEEGLALELYGKGQVAQALLPLLARHDIPVRRIHDSQGPCHLDAEVDGHPVLVDCTAPSYTGEAAGAWIRHLEARLQEGVPLVTCNKAPLALAWKRLTSAGAPILHAATVGGGTPIIPTLQRLALAQPLRRIEASLSGTLAFVLERVWSGADLEDAVRDAQAAGFAEPDPSLDLDGTDALAKAVILHNRFLAADPITLDELPRLSIDEEEVRRFDAPPHLIVEIRPGGIAWCLQDAPWVDAGATGPGSAAVRATTADGTTFRVAGPGAGPETTAANILADLLELRSTWRGLCTS